MTSFYLDYLFKGPISKYSHSDILGSGLQHMNFRGRGYYSAHNNPQLQKDNRDSEGPGNLPKVTQKFEYLTPKPMFLIS